MIRARRAGAAALAGMVGLSTAVVAAPAADAQVELVTVTMSIENLAGADGTLQTPFWLGLHDGGFDTYDRGVAASPALERLAEDGSPMALAELFAATSSGGQSVITGPTGPFQPGDGATVTWTLNPNDARYRFLSYASMVIPSNDAFVANGNPEAHPLFDADGNFVATDILITGDQVLDAGTEVNDEVPGNTAALAQAAPNTGVTENGTVELFGGFNPGGNVLDARPGANVDDGAPVARISFSVSPLNAPAPAPAPETPEAPSDAVEFDVTIRNVSDGFALSDSGGFNTPAGSDGPGPALPGDTYEFNFNAGEGDRLSFATMLVQSNDWFFSPAPDGIALFNDDGTPKSDLTSEINVYDSGTEIDQPLGAGVDQAPRQAGPNTGAADPNTAVRGVNDLAPPVSDLISVELVDNGSGNFTARITNVSGDSELPGPIAPGAYAVHQSGSPIFDRGVADRGVGLEGVAEDGSNADLVAHLEANTGVATPLAPGAFAASAESGALFVPGSVDRGEGLEQLAEDGGGADLAAAAAARATDAGAFGIPSGADAPGPALPGSSYSFTVSANPGDALSLATMFVQTNDWFFGTDSGIALFDDAGNPISGDVTSSVAIYDAGTEADQPVGFGADQAPRQAGPNTGETENGTIERLGSASGYIEVIVTPR